MSRVSSTEQAKSAINQVQSIINGGFTDQISALDAQGKILSFRSASYHRVKASEPVDLYRVYGGDAGPLSPFWSRDVPAGPLQAQLDSALNPAWGNTATEVSHIRVPAGTRFYEGFAAPQPLGGASENPWDEAYGSLLGGGNQVYIDRMVPDEWVVK